MRIQLLYFAAVRDQVGVADEHVELPAGVTDVAALRGWLEAHRPALAGRLDPVRFAIDESFVTASAVLHEGAVVALIPPVAGG